MTGFDYVVVSILLISLAIGAWRGLVSEVLALLAWVIAFLVAKHFSGLVEPLFSSVSSEPLIRQAGSFALLFIASLLVLGLLRLLLREALHAVGLGLADRMLGALFGLVRGLLMVFLLVLLGGLTEFPKQPWWYSAMFAPPLETAVLTTMPWMPEQLAKRIKFR
ncbi:CvpA family protein [Niveibacterium umoris]|uniref:Membrane protein required for colicin V production n=1 Tax=Niveibacterium umoris TaxID=1193620 RepID=A0A840BIE8_9RHOO|nr:CvpA family protein [Niveibacterium umoris]MBB4012104.1 membrane protein required for colicin V production [Niveibacterium umoris]